MVTSVRILGLDYPVLVQFKDTDTYLDGKFGYFDGVRMRIVLAANNDPGVQGEVLLHEIVHAIDAAMQTGLEEDQVGRLSRGLFAVLKDNPGLLAHILNEVNHA